MMIGPDTYYEINLKGKDKEYILSAIREMQDEIVRLKELMENPDDSSYASWLHCRKTADIQNHEGKWMAS